MRSLPRADGFAERDRAALRHLQQAPQRWVEQPWLLHMLCLDHRDQRHSNLLPWCDDGGKLKMIAASLGMDYYQGVVAVVAAAVVAVAGNGRHQVAIL